MIPSGFKAGLGLIALAAFATWACTDDSEPGPADQEAGAAGMSGSDEVAGAAGSGSAGKGAGGDAGGASGSSAGRGEGGHAGAGDACTPRSVRDYCDWLENRPVPQSCPENPEDFDLEQQCGPYNGVDRHASDCGGVVVEVWGDKMNGFDYYSTYFSFDAQGALVGVSFTNDTATDCPSDWGAPCARTEHLESLCPAGGAGGQGGGSG